METKEQSKTISPNRFENSEPMVLAGMQSHFTFQTMDEIPQLWQQFAPNIGNVPGQVGSVTYGLTIDPPEEGKGFHYMAAVEIQDRSQIPEGLSTLNVPANRYAVFVHPGNLDTLRDTIQAALADWLPASGEEHAESPFLLERYGEGFDPETRSGDIEIWVPIK